jgi:Dockerin type I domain
MSRRLLIGGLLAVAAVAFYAPPAGAAFHLWTISEVYSNSDGSVQFIELFTSSVGQTFTNNTQIKSNSNTFTFPANLSQDTTNKHMLLATAGFGSLAGGVAPDFTIPKNFFNPAGDTINYVFTLAGTVTFASAPTDGISSLNFPGPTTAVNSPTNLAGMSGSVNLASPPTPTGDYNHDGKVDAADYTRWRDTLGQTVASGTGADGNGNGKIDTPDYTFWANHFGNVVAGSASGGGQTISAPEPSTRTLLVIGCVVALVARRR